MHIQKEFGSADLLTFRSMHKDQNGPKAGDFKVSFQKM